MAQDLGRMARTFGLPPIHALIEEGASEKKVAELQRNNVIVHHGRLHRPLSSDEILRMTRNPRGIDLTNGRFSHEVTRNYYDWLSFEILNQRPNYVIVPYGTGDLYDNILHHYRSVLLSHSSDPRLRSTRRVSSGLHVIGITAEQGSPADKLTAPHLPGSSLEEYRSLKANEVTQHMRAGVIGDHSGIHYVRDTDLYRAKQLADRIGLKAEYSALAGIAWLLRNGNTIPSGSRVVIVSTGKGITED